MRPHAACAKCLPPEHYLQAAEAAASHGTPTQAAYATYGETRSYPSQVSPAHLLTYAGPHLTPQSPLGTPLDLASISPQSPLGSPLLGSPLNLPTWDLPSLSPLLGPPALTQQMLFPAVLLTVSSWPEVTCGNSTASSAAFPARAATCSNVVPSGAFASSRAARIPTPSFKSNCGLGRFAGE